MNPERMTFSCAACGITLTVPRSMAGISGPCPSCARAMRPPTDGPPKGGFFSRMGVWIFVLLLASPFLLFGGMLFDLNGMLGDKQTAEEQSEETALINMIDQIVHPGDPKWQQQAGAQNLESAILTEGRRLQLEEELEEEEELEPEETTTEELP